MLSHLGKARPLEQAQLQQLATALAQLDNEQKIWLSGYLAGQATQSNLTTDSLPASHSRQAEQLTVLYGSQTGNTQSLAESFYATAQSQGFNVKLISLADYQPRQLLKEKYIVLLVSTHGEGDPPDDAEILHEFLYADKAPDLSGLNFAVLALGDSSYEQFCQTGIEFDEQLVKLGALRLVNRVDCDLDYEHEAQAWQQQTIETLAKTIKPIDNVSSNVVPLANYQAQTSNPYNRQNPYSAEVLSLQKITTNDSVKNIYHIELSLEDSQIDYQPGDSLAVIAHNPTNHVLELISLLNLNPEETVNLQDQSLTLFQTLMDKKEISLLNRKFLKFLAEITKDKNLSDTVSNQDSFEQFVASRQLIDVFKAYPATLTAQQLVDELPGITPRSYSIASSHQANPEEVHLTVALVKTDENRTGLVSGHLSQHIKVGDFVDVYLEHNNHFRLPENPDTPIIMIGPGTGVAPFRAFLQQREALEHSGENWLLFGNPSFENDFLYQLEWQKFIQSGVLNKMDVAFSRDQEHKVYVQHRLEQQAKEVWQWLQRGAHIYLCGDKNRMAKDVESTLLNIIQQHGELSAEQATDYLKDLKRAKRYQKDVY
ncbi:MAG: assimilatory sulfite reductase (NADPH) flavoprotein subunit [Marinicella sp.]